ncbi:protein kinase [Streptomyces tropicalis]|uniref:Protein kinase n=1 Tax=Streptomyces tropicalis TaxID=3034234 RepID=A0ABT6A8W2_9ACTN|nr:protein kinase [Streptomyces tropicalis]MDF3301095.1 protein kinase [Streptomyces tropicalis]
MDDYAGRVLADRYRLPLPPSDEYELTESRAFDTYSGQEVLVRQVPLPEVVEAEVLDADGLPDGFTARAGAARRPPARSATRRPADPSVRRAVEAAQAAARIPDHARLDQVFDVFAEGGSLWVVSELVAARPLAALLAGSPLSPYRAAEIASDVLTALRVLHAHGWVHRNITARTVLVCDDGRVMLTGLAVGAAEEALCGYDPVPPDPDGGDGGEPPDAAEPGPDGPRPKAHPGPDTHPVPGGPGGADPEAARRAAIEARATGALPGRGTGTASGSPGAGTPRALETGEDVRAARAGAIAAYRAGARAAARVQETGQPGPRPALPGARPPADAATGPQHGPAAPDPRPGTRPPFGTDGAPGAPVPYGSGIDGRPGSRPPYGVDEDRRAGVPSPYGPDGDRRPGTRPPYGVDAVRRPGGSVGPHGVDGPPPYGGHSGGRPGGVPAQAAPALGAASGAGRPFVEAARAHREVDGAPAHPAGGDVPGHPEADGPGAARWGDLVAGVPAARRGPATALAAERARQARMTVVGPVTERWAPEQAGPVHENWQLAAPIGPATDLWALGALLFRAVQGHAPYPEESTAELVQMVCAEPPAYAEECGPLRPVVESLLRQDPTERIDFEELRGWLRSLVRSAPEPDAGAHVVAAPPADPSRLPVVRRRGELVRRRRAGLPAPHGRHKRAREQERSPRSLGRTLLLLILLVLAGVVAYAMLLMPKADHDGAAGGGRTSAAGDASSAAPDGGASGAGRPDPAGSGTGNGAPPSSGSADTRTTAPEVADGFTLRRDPAGFRMAVPKGWSRQPRNDRGQIVYEHGGFQLVVVPGRDTSAEFGGDPMAYQRDKESELQAYRDSSWATSSGMRTIQVGGRTMAEGQFTWTGSDGTDLFVRNLALLQDGRYHVVQVRGPETQRDRVTAVYEQASASYRFTG